MNYKTPFAPFIILFFIFSSQLYSQQSSQTLRGYVFDKESHVPLPFVSVLIKNLPQKSVITDSTGRFEFKALPVGRYDLQFYYVGYEPMVVPEIMLSSGKETVIEVRLKEQVTSLKEVVVNANGKKESTTNSMSIISGRTFTVEEANRYAGGFDDPGRLVSSFAGVSSSGNEGSNAIVIRGNSPKGVLWTLEGIDIPSPNHYDGGDVAGGGFISVLSSQVLTNSDFYSGAFPAEYGNALSGIFDMQFKTGNAEKREFGVKAGLVGAELFAEGPFVKGKSASYIFNYRYSMLAIIAKLIPSSNIPVYQDVSFKLNFPTKKMGTFSVWGIGAYDDLILKKPDSLNWKYLKDKRQLNMQMSLGVLGVTNRSILNNKTFLNTTVVLSGTSTNLKVSNIDRNYDVHDSISQDYNTSNLILKSYVNHKFGTLHKNRTGISINLMNDRLNNKIQLQPMTEMQSFSKSNNSTAIFRFFSQSNIQLLPTLTFHLGVNTQYYSLNEALVIEPRTGLNWAFGNNHTISIGYGKHSRLEPLQIYYVEMNHPSGITHPNAKLKPSKANHLGLGYDKLFGSNIRLKFEVFYQHLYDIPVTTNGTYSLINYRQEFAFRDSLVNHGKGINKGVELTFERFLSNGFYFLTTATLMKSTYSDVFGKWHNTRYDYGYLVNFLSGYEFKLSKKENFWGINLKLSTRGSEKVSPVNQDSTIAKQDVILDETRPFTNTFPTSVFVDINITYRINKPNHSIQFGLQLKNILGAKSNYEYQYNLKTGKAEVQGIPVSFPNFFVRVDF